MFILRNFPLEQYSERLSYDANGNILTLNRNGNLASPGIRMDKLSYNYYSGNNRLNFVTDSVPNGTYADDIDNQTLNNYTYDEIGNLVKDNKEGITNVVWNVYGKIANVNKLDSSSTNTNKGRVRQVTYTYDAGGQRISKKVSKYTNAIVDYTWYVRDASGNILSTYSSSGDSTTALSAQNLIQNEVYLFGSSRLGSFTVNRNAEAAQLIDTTYLLPLVGYAVKHPFARGLKQYELSNHQQTPLTTISDKKIPVSANLLTVDYYLADIVSATGIYSGGMLQPGRSFSTNKYQFSINGQIKSDEIAPNTTSAEFWEFDSRVQRRWQPDPKPTVSESPYLCFSGNPILNTDIDGDVPFDGGGRKKKNQNPTALTNKAPATPKPAIKPLKTLIPSTGLDGITVKYFDPFKARRKESDTYEVKKEPERNGRGIVFTSKSGQGQGGGPNATNPDSQPVNIDGMLDMFSMANKAKQHPLKPDFSDPWSTVNASGKVAKQLGKDQVNKDLNANTNTNESNVNNKPIEVLEYPRQKEFDTFGMSKFIGSYGPDSLTFFDPNANKSNDDTKPDTGRVIIFKKPKKHIKE
jgi:hypothetical protein